MTCPSIDELAAGAAPEHAQHCEDCRAVLEVIAARAPAGCGLAEALLAARAAGRVSAHGDRLLAVHLASCASCELVAGSLDAPGMADAFASAAALERRLDEHAAARPGPARSRHGTVLGVLALLALAAIAAVVARALG
jgi:hypothetical protein